MNLIESEYDLGARSDAGERPVSGEKFISFELGGNLCCVAAGRVSEVVHPAAIAPVPNSPDWLLGLAAHRAEPVAVIDPVSVVGTSASETSKAKFLVFHPRPGEIQFALPIDLLHEMILLPTAPGRLSEFLHDGRRLRFIDPEQLFESFAQDPIPTY